MNILKQTKSWIILVFLLGSFQLSAGIDFQDISLKSAKAKAKKEGKMIFIDAYAIWCGPCKWMTANVFNDEQVGKYFNEHFISLKVDMEKSGGKEINQVHEVGAYPTLLVIDPTGKVLRVKEGAMEIEDFISFGKYALNPETVPYLATKKRFEAGERSFDFLFEHLINTVDEDKEYESLVPILFENLVVDSLISQKGFLVFKSFPRELSSPHSTYFMENIETFLMNYEESIEIYVAIVEKAIETHSSSKEVIVNRYTTDFKNYPEALVVFDEMIQAY